MEERWPLAGGGTLRVWEEGPWVRLEAERPDDGKGLYKVWCRGPGGEYLLGTLAPGAGGLRLERRVSRGTLREAGAWPVTGGRAAMVYPFAPAGEEGAWRREDHPEGLCSDPVVRACLRGARGLLSRERGGVRQLAAPFSTCKPILLNTLFCLARVEERQGARYLVWRFDREGRPLLPGIKRGEGGEK